MKTISFTSEHRSMFRNRIPRADRALAALLAVAGLLALASAASPAPNQFVILSDIHPARGAEPQLKPLTEQLLALKPAFVIQLGDFEGGGTLPGSAPGAESAMQLFRTLREAGVDVYPVIGNHDLGRDKHDFLCTHQPPLNPELDPTTHPAVHERWCDQDHYWYSFNRGGIHFVILDSNVNPAEDQAVPGQTPFADQMAWLKRDVCRGEGNPGRLPTVLLMHDVDFFGSDTRSAPGPVYRVLQDCPDVPVVAAFGGHWHHGEGFPPENNLGVRSYATEASVHLVVPNPEYIIATVHPDRITFRTVDTRTGGPGKTGLVYDPIPGRFGDLAARAAAPGRQ
jgi:hypothetical protein